MWWATDMIKVPPFGPAQSQASQPLLPAQEAGAVVSAVVPGAPPPPVAAPGVTQDDAYCADTPGPELVPTKDCLGFVFCQNSRMSGSTTLCSPGLLFDANMGICNWPSETNLCETPAVVIHLDLPRDWHICSKHIEQSQQICINPSKSFVHPIPCDRIRAIGTKGANHGVQLDVPLDPVVLFSVVECEWVHREPLHFDFRTEFLADLPFQGAREGLTVFHLPPREFKQAIEDI